MASRGPKTGFAGDAARSDTLLAGPVPRRSTDRLGAVLAGRFELQGLLGSGGMGSVYLALDRDLDEAVAVKLLHPSVGGSEGTLAGIRHEVKLARRVTHRNVARIHELGHEGDRWFLTMEYIDGVSLADVMSGDTRVPVARAIEILVAVCSGLDAVHQAGVIHGDVKPANIMVARDGRVVLGDFGIARFADAGGAGSREVVGTPAYMAPEQVTGAPLGPTADLYALGVVAFEMLTGQLPFTGRNAIEIASARLIREAPDVTSLSPDVPPPVARAVGAALCRESAGRPASAREFRRALDGQTATSEPAIPSVDVVDLYINAQWLYRHVDRVEQAVELLERALARAPASAVVQAGYAVALARLWMMAGGPRFEATRDAVARAMELGPHLGETHFAGGILALHSGDPVSAAASIREAMTRAPGLADAHFMAASLLFEIDCFEAAVTRLSVGRRLDPGRSSENNLRARTEALRGDWSRTEEVIAAEIKPGSLKLMFACRMSAYRRDRDTLERLAAVVASAPPATADAARVFNQLPVAFLGRLDPDALRWLVPAQDAATSTRRLAMRHQLVAEVAGMTGRDELVLEALELADREGKLIDWLWVSRCPLLDSVRSDARFAAIRDRVRERASAVARALGFEPAN